MSIKTCVTTNRLIPDGTRIKNVFYNDVEQQIIPDGWEGQTMVYHRQVTRGEFCEISKDFVIVLNKDGLEVFRIPFDMVEVQWLEPVKYLENPTVSEDDALSRIEKISSAESLDEIADALK